MALTRHKHNTGSTIGTTEFSIINGNTTFPAAETMNGSVILIVDVGALLAGDHYQVAKYEKAHDSDAQIKEILANLVGVIPGARFETYPMTMGNGWDFTLKKIAGTDRSLGYSLWVWEP